MHSSTMDPSYDEQYKIALEKQLAKVLEVETTSQTPESLGRGIEQLEIAEKIEAAIDAARATYWMEQTKKGGSDRPFCVKLRWCMLDRVGEILGEEASPKDFLRRREWDDRILNHTAACLAPKKQADLLQAQNKALTKIILNKELEEEKLHPEISLAQRLLEEQQLLNAYHKSLR
jgi:hypothetical protein